MAKRRYDEEDDEEESEAESEYDAEGALDAVIKSLTGEDYLAMVGELANRVDTLTKFVAGLGEDLEFIKQAMMGGAPRGGSVTAEGEGEGEGESEGEAEAEGQYELGSDVPRKERPRLVLPEAQQSFAQPGKGHIAGSKPKDDTMGKNLRKQIEDVVVKKLLDVGTPVRKGIVDVITKETMTELEKTEEPTFRKFYEKALGRTDA